MTHASLDSKGKKTSGLSCVQKMVVCRWIFLLVWCVGLLPPVHMLSGKCNLLPSASLSSSTSWLFVLFMNFHQIYFLTSRPHLVASSPLSPLYEELDEGDECYNFTQTVSTEITSPNYPHAYPMGLDCHKVVKGWYLTLSIVNITAFTDCVLACHCIPKKPMGIYTILHTTDVSV